jgi:hypothetical protein
LVVSGNIKPCKRRFGPSQTYAYGAVERSRPSSRVLWAMKTSQYASNSPLMLNLSALF